MITPPDGAVIGFITFIASTIRRVSPALTGSPSWMNGAAPFVAVGDTVKPGDTLLIVEAMKVMNPITAPHGGIVKQLMVENGQPVEFDQTLVVLG